jgi:hypothetical protein
MCNRWIGLGLLLSLGVVWTPGQVQAQPFYEVPGNANITVPVLGHDRPETGGFYTALEFTMLNQTKALGSQVVAVRGFFDTTGLINGTTVIRPVFDPTTGLRLLNAAGVPIVQVTNVRGTAGTFVGSRTIALSTENINRTSFEPGFNITLGYRFDSGFSLSASYMRTFDAKYTASASLVAPGFKVGGPTIPDTGTGVGSPSVADSFLTANVFNFPNNFSGPQFDTNFDGNVLDEDGNPRTNLTYGIWNAATQMDILFTQRFQTFELMGRLPVYSTDYSRTYALAGGKFAWFYENFRWRTVNTDVNGIALEQDIAEYNNKLSQRLYGPVIGCGNEIYLTQGFAASLDTTGGLLIDFSKATAKYELGDETIQNKRTTKRVLITPNVNVGANLWWYPLQNIQVRLGYQGQFYFNTQYMADPISFNYGAIDPGYDNKFLRIVHGLNVGIGLTF